MNAYTASDRASIRAISPIANPKARVLTIQHVGFDRYKTVSTHWFPTKELALDFAIGDGAEVDIPQYWGDIAFSGDGENVRIVTLL